MAASALIMTRILKTEGRTTSRARKMIDLQIVRLYD